MGIISGRENDKNDCYKTCQTCSKSPSKDKYGNIKSQNCKECKNKYNFLAGTNDCYDSSIKKNGYYLSSKDSKYHKCDIQCKTCEDNPPSNEPYCTSCNYEHGYFQAENEPSSKCYNQKTIKKNYYLKDLQDIKDKKWMLCHSSCSTCFGNGNSSFHNCFSCAKDKYFISGTTNCISKEYASKNGFYFVSYNKTFLKCDKACSKCEKGYEKNNTNCLECNLENKFYPLYESESNCFNEETIYDGFYLNKNNNEYKWDKCYERCEKCTSKGNSTNMNCLSCKNNLMNKLTSKLYLFKLNENGNCIEYCSNNLYLTSIGDCVDICPNNTFSFYLNHTCLDRCPQKYETHEKFKKCVLKNFDDTTPKYEFQYQILNNITEFINSSKIVNGSDFTAVISYSDDMNQKEQIDNGKSAIDLGNCTSTIKNYYNISEDEKLIIVNMEQKYNKSRENKNDENSSIDLGKNMQIEVYDTSGNQLNLSVCKEDIKVMRYIGDVEILNIQSAKSLSAQGIDSFNRNDKFFNDLCHPYKNENKDIILKDRVSDIYQNVDICQKGCINNGMNYDLKIANCICDSSMLQVGIDNNTNINDKNGIEEKVNLKEIKKIFKSSLEQITLFQEIEQ